MEENQIEYELIEKIEIRNRSYAIIAEKGKEDEAFVMRIKEVKGVKDLVPVNDDKEFDEVMKKYEEKFIDVDDAGDEEKLIEEDEETITEIDDLAGNER
ncbi:DUF1292 domain-containing protein [Clostridium cellulovorans]|uniref:Uncharacterized protein n=1 Tax=Clostridium cellulovorans (strain ATCC 35296 / DSM 3052 / OCM 3 / 743B) TaxID=573061 RepID=D9SPQ0_CLOC7|nr:DUF1292 domain-containing protein [Clostridium cellulovorans]ADL50099.1 protein of unknown function DUF1292 [Clostridium cellulovorans 743B]